MTTTFRDTIASISVGWLQEVVGGGILYCAGLAIDAMYDETVEGVKARFPGVGPEDSLQYIGNDRVIERGPNESSSSYVLRLRKAFDTWAVAGNAAKMLEALRIYYLPALPPIRAVSDRAVWHAISNDEALNVTRTAGANWNWDGTVKPHRGWVIIDSTAGPYAAKTWGDGHAYGDGTTWGSTANAQDVNAIQRLVRKWKPAHVKVTYIVVTFDASIFEVADTAPPNPNGDFGDSPTPRLINAAFWEAGAST